MSKKNSGYLVTFTNLEGQRQKGLVRHEEQTKELFKQKKLLIRHLDDKMNQVMENGREKTSIKSAILCKVIGFSD